MERRRQRRLWAGHRPVAIAAPRLSRWPARGTIVTVPLTGSSGEPCSTSASSPISTYWTARSARALAARRSTSAGAGAGVPAALSAGCSERLRVAQRALQPLAPA